MVIYKLVLIQEQNLEVFYTQGYLEARNRFWVLEQESKYMPSVYNFKSI
jgi:hypothetical protein